MEIETPRTITADAVFLNLFCNGKFGHGKTSTGSIPKIEMSKEDGLNVDIHGRVERKGWRLGWVGCSLGSGPETKELRRESRECGTEWREPLQITPR